MALHTIEGLLYLMSTYYEVPMKLPMEYLTQLHFNAPSDFMIMQQVLLNTMKNLTMENQTQIIMQLTVCLSGLNPQRKLVFRIWHVNFEEIQILKIWMFFW